jgi:hypothetical protein
MAARKNNKVKVVADESYSKLEQYCIWLNEFYKALRKSGFTVDNALWLITSKDSFPDWIKHGNTSPEEIVTFLEDEDE